MLRTLFSGESQDFQCVIRDIFLWFVGGKLTEMGKIIALSWRENQTQVRERERESGERGGMSFKSFYAQVAGVTDVAFVYPFVEQEEEENEEGGEEGGGEEAGAKNGGSVALERVLTCGADCSTQLREFLSDEVEQELSDHLDAVNALAVSPLGGKFATVGDDHAVKLYSYPECEALASLDRFTLPVRAVGFSHDGAQLAAAGDDEGVKVLSAQDASVIRVIHGISSVKHLQYDPKGEWLVVGTCDGVLVAYDTDAGMKRKDWGEVLPKVKPKSMQMNRFAFEPVGRYLAVPGKAGDVVVYERDSWREAFVLSGAHTLPVSVVCWSPNGRYLVSAGADRNMIVWDVAKQTAVATRQSEATVCGLSWRRNANCVACIDCEGNLGVWSCPVPSGNPSPVAESAVGTGVAGDAALFFDDEAADDGDDSDEDNEDREGGGAAADGAAGMDGADDDVDAAGLGSGAREYRGGGARSGIRVANVQKAFQSNVTQYAGNPPRRFLAYNLVGTVISRDEGTYNVIEVAFHDTGVRMGRVPAVSDYYGFTMAALSDHGVALASPGGDTPSTVMFRPFESWAADAGWDLQLPEGVSFSGIAVGRSWIAATTSHNELHVFSLGGMQTFVMTLPGQAVSIAAYEENLAIVWHDGASASGADQRLSYMVVDVSSQEKLHDGPLPMSIGATLTWLDFASGGRLATADSSGVVRMRVSEFGGSWMPVMTKEDEEAETLWIVGIENTSLTYIKCRAPSKEPSVLPKPVLDERPLRVPIVKSKSERIDDLQRAFVRDSSYLTHLKDKAATSEEEAVEDDVLGAENALDRCILKMMHEACKSDQLVRALEAASMLNRTQSLEGALKLANSMRLPALAEKIGVLIRTREELEAMAGDEYELDEHERMQVRTTAMEATRRPTGNPFSRPAAPTPTAKATKSYGVDRLESRDDVPVLKTPAPTLKRSNENMAPVNPFSRSKLSKTNS